jgi:hypothetical protein
MYISFGLQKRRRFARINIEFLFNCGKQIDLHLTILLIFFLSPVQKTGSNYSLSPATSVGIYHC